jgi:hypothetical protein
LFAGSTVIAGCAIVGALAPTARPSGSPVPSTMLGRYLTIAADSREGLVFELRLRAPENAICKNIARASGQSGTCFTLGKKDVPLSVDPGARGHATILGGRLQLKMTLVPYEKECEGSVTLYAINQRQTKLTRVRGTCGDKRYVEQR